MIELKTLQDVLEIDPTLSGPLTPENGETYNYELGEPKYHYSYKVGESKLKHVAKEWIKHYMELGNYFEKTNRERSSRHYAQAVALEIFFNLED